MTSTRSTISRGALLVALMASSSALAGGAAYADVLGGTGSVPLPAPLPSVPLLTDPDPSPSPSPSPTESATPAPAEQPAQSTDAPAPSGDSASATSTSGSQEVAATTETAPAPVAAPAPAPVAAAPVAARPVTASPTRAGGPVVPPVAQPLAPVDSAAPAGVPHAAARLDLADGPISNALGSFSGFPQLSAGSLTLPGLPQLPGLRPMIAPGQASPLAPLLIGSAASPTDVPLVRAGHSSPVQPGSTGIVLFVMASAAGAAGMARVRIYRRSVVRR